MSQILKVHYIRGILSMNVAMHAQFCKTIRVGSQRTSPNSAFWTDSMSCGTRGYMDSSPNDRGGKFPADRKRTSYVKEYPHIHMHYMQNDTSLCDDGHCDLEMCCHGCDSSILYRYSVAAMIVFEQQVAAGEADPGRGHPRLRELRDEFIDRHSDCIIKEARGAYITACPPARKFMNFVDLRKEGL